MKKKLAIGIDIGGTNTQFGFISEAGDCIIKNSISTVAYPDLDKYLDALYLAIKETQNQIEEEIEIVGIGIGAPNGNFYTGSIEYAPNLKWKGIINLAELVKSHFKIPVFLTNDANAAAIGEMVYGAAKDMKDFMVITLGTGLGSGIVVNGEVVYGHDGFAGELGHVIVVEDGRQCGCGRKGCLETYASATGIKRTVIRMLGSKQEESELRNFTYNMLSGKIIEQAANHGDKIALEAFEYTGKKLGMALANAIAISSPEAIFLFGGLANSKELIFKPTHYHMEKNLLQIFKNKVQLLPSGLNGANAAIMGASALVWKELKK